MDHNPLSLTDMFSEEVILNGIVTRPCSCTRRCSQSKGAIFVLKYCGVNDGGVFKVHFQMGPNLLEQSP